MKRIITIVVLLTVLGAWTFPASAARWGRGRGTTVRTQHGDQQQDARGAVTAVNIMKRDIVVGNRTFNVPGYATITINGARGALEQIKVGDQASIGYTVHKYTTSRSGGYGRSRGGGRSYGSRSSQSNTGKAGSSVADSVTITR